MLDSVLEICSVEGIIELLRTRAQAITGARNRPVP
jgi:hypothetical protein